MTDPRKYLLRMLFFIIVVGAIIFILNEPLINAFQANVAINGLIFGVLFVQNQCGGVVQVQEQRESI